ncbi:hypothetical protein [Variovorax sp. RCC_210]|uniref:hypothetical protein n=1 Tax=Variovorax sp. RCC_210 TaxID=3239217 RepID=UPI00352560E2
MTDPDATNTALTLAGAALALQCEILDTLMTLQVIPASEALLTVQRARRKLEGTGQPGGVRASIYLEPVEEDVRQHIVD